jgi:two-component system KDP operon response regulator KdpE
MSGLEGNSTFELERIKIDKSKNRVFVSGQEVHLTPTEYRLLIVLSENAGRIVTHKQLLLEVWGKEYLEEVQYLRIYMGHLRRKLSEYSSEDKMLVTEPRIGYRLAI